MRVDSRFAYFSRAGACAVVAGVVLVAVRVAAIAAGMRAYNPDSTWTLVEED